MNRYIAITAMAVTAFFLTIPAWAQSVSVATLTNGPPNIPYGAPGNCTYSNCTWIQAGLPAGSPVSDVYADMLPMSSNYGGSFSLTGPNASSFSISTASDGTRNVGHITTSGTVAAGDYDITVNAGTASQRTTVHAVNGTRVGCPGGANDQTVANVANAAGNGATLLFPACTYSWSNTVVVPTNQTWVGIPGRTIFDAGGGGPRIMLSGFDNGTTGVTLANLTLQNLGTNNSNTPGCQAQGAGSVPTCQYQNFMIQTNNGWTVRNTVMQNGVWQAVTMQFNGGTVNFLNDVVHHFGGHGYSASVSNGTLNIVGNDMSDFNYTPVFTCDDSGNKFLGANWTNNWINNYVHDAGTTAGFWDDTGNNDSHNFTGNTYVNVGQYASGMNFENDHVTAGTVSFNAFVGVGNSTGQAGRDCQFNFTSHASSAVNIGPSQNMSIHDNNISATIGSAAADGSVFAGGAITFSQECSGTVVNNNNTIRDNSITFFAHSGVSTTGNGSDDSAFGAVGDNCQANNIDGGGNSADGDAFHFAYSGASANDPHFAWFPNWHSQLSLASFKSSYGQESHSTLDFVDGSATGCRHVACSGAGIGAGGVQLTGPSGLAIQSIALSSSTFTPNVANGVVGTVAVTMSDGSAFSGKLSMTGTNSGGFQVSGNILEEKASGTPAGSYNDFNLVATQSTASNSPQQVSPTVTGIVDAPFGGVTGIVDAPFGGTARSITNRIQAEDFDVGGYGVAYHATDACTLGIDTTYGPDRLNVYPTTDLDSENNLKVGCNQAGDWHNYTITVPTTGTYTLNMRVADIETGSSYHVAVDGASVVSGIAVPNTGDYDTFATVTSQPFGLTAGQHILQLVLDAVGSSGFGGDFNWMQGTLVKAGAITSKNIDIIVTH